ncbi:MAG: HesA/MoeB/ThiF family protein [Muribaculaceae bacterium]|nr:HesA/MoeB/ThiF family protein [Muribaculaceae bacterium]
MRKEERQRYSRQIAIEEIKAAGQEKLLTSSVLIVGCGALGSLAAMELAGAGIGRIGIADFDTVDISNLQRQFFFSSCDAGKRKAQILGERMKLLNPGCKVEIIEELISEKNAMQIFPSFDFIVDATDNAASKNLVEKIGEKCGKPCCIGGVVGFRGQLMTIFPGDIKFSDIFHSENVSSSYLPCEIEGVAGPAAAVCASILACEAMKSLLGIRDLLRNRLLIFDLLHNKLEVLTIG